MSDVSPEVEQAIAGMSDGDFNAFVARVRAPDSAELLRTAAAKYVPAEQLDSVMGIVNAAAFIRDGQLDEAKVHEHFGRLYGTTEPRRYGQHSGTAPGDKPGAAARAALTKRHHVKRDSDQPGPGDRIIPGAGGRAALARRHGGKK